jgi:hypothetical protein
MAAFDKSERSKALSSLPKRDMASLLQLQQPAQQK